MQFAQMEGKVAVHDEKLRDLAKEVGEIREGMKGMRLHGEPGWD